MKLSEKIYAIRKTEGLSQREFCNILNLSFSTLTKYETQCYEPSGSNLLKITQHPQFEKYALWLMTDKIAPESGQIAPDLARYGRKRIIYHRLRRKTG
ncbi:helix-turn-helix domain-containing protein [Arsenophonus nasoniae]|uniref:Helix-turn-helix transcriptional regulator n=1 Tax=Arsenophonus nasoniae TaxID=638 RepID=A0AA95G8K6_9GAMM|nr:helix-turn-helix transcriptional regulator [Arsenophonus nasoniae]WGL93972.1 helix-turn-helix transcriptional regulator [Arsenophonus nasoniae]